MGIALNLRQLALIEYKYGISEKLCILKLKPKYSREDKLSIFRRNCALLSHVQPGKLIYERHEFNKIYDALWKDSAMYFEQGHVETDSYLLDLQNDRRRGLSIIAFPNQEVTQTFRYFTRTLMRIDADQYYYLPNQFHVTILPLFTATENFAPFFEKIPEYKKVIRSVLSNIDCLSITFSGVTASRSAVMVKGFTEEPVLNQLRDQLIGALHESELDEGLYSRYQRTTAHSTIVRFKNSQKI
jgi:2'-5' RNA ligase